MDVPFSKRPWSATIVRDMMQIKGGDWLFRFVRGLLMGRGEELGNRRDTHRIPHAAEVIGRLKGVDYPCQLIDIGHEGLRLRAPVHLSRGAEVLVSSKPETGLVGRQRLKCRVAWTRKSSFGTEAGLQYCDSRENIELSWIQLALRQLDPSHGRRRVRRIESGLAVTLQDKTGQPLGGGECVNLGTGGALLRLPRALVSGDAVRVGLGTGDREANIVLLSRVVSNQPDAQTGQFLVGVRFYPGENRDHQRLRSLLLNLLDEGHQEA